jgi:gamma-glutamylcyclotransferase (GGCT)/AIG2-like uncharacterized protein YtfP
MGLYFAYGSNMVRDQMALRCPGAALLGTAMLAQHRFAIIRGGHGTVLPQPGSTIHGVLWRLARGDEKALDRYEEVAGGLYRRAQCVVRHNDKPCSALVYIAAATEPGRARAAYLAAILAAARDFNFPADYVRALAAL